MGTPEFGQNLSNERKGLGRRIARRLPLISRVYLTLMTALLAATDHQPAYSQIINNSYQPTHSVEDIILNDVMPEIPLNPLSFTTNTAESGELLTIYGTKPLSPNKDTSVNDTNILKVGGVVQAEIQGYEPLLPGGISNLSTLAKQYHPKADLIYLLESYYIPGQDQYRAPLVILYVQRSNARDYTAQRRMEVSLPTLIHPEYISSFNISDDRSSLQIGIKDEIDPVKKTSVDIGINEKGGATGIVQIKQFLRRLWLSVLLDQSK